MEQKFSGNHPFVGVVFVFNRTGNLARDDQAANFPLTTRPEESATDGVLSGIVNTLAIHVKGDQASAIAAKKNILPSSGTPIVHIYAFDAILEAKEWDGGLPRDFAFIAKERLDRKPDIIRVGKFSASELGIALCPA